MIWHDRENFRLISPWRQRISKNMNHLSRKNVSFISVIFLFSFVKFFYNGISVFFGKWLHSNQLVAKTTSPIDTNSISLERYKTININILFYSSTKFKIRQILNIENHPIANISSPSWPRSDEKLKKIRTMYFVITSNK